jgi:hypothetical protein
MRCCKRLSLAVLLLAPAVAAAQPVSGFYGSASGGPNFHASGSDGFAEWKAGKSGSGYAATGAAGYGFGNGLRIELEGSQRGNGHAFQP